MILGRTKHASFDQNVLVISYDEQEAEVGLKHHGHVQQDDTSPATLTDLGRKPPKTNTDKTVKQMKG